MGFIYNNVVFMLILICFNFWLCKCSIHLEFCPFYPCSIFIRKQLPLCYKQLANTPLNYLRQELTVEHWMRWWYAWKIFTSGSRRLQPRRLDNARHNAGNGAYLKIGLLKFRFIREIWFCLLNPRWGFNDVSIHYGS